MRSTVNEFFVIIWLLGLALLIAWFFNAWAISGWLLAVVVSGRWLLALFTADHWLHSGGRRLNALSAGPLSDFLYAAGRLLSRERRQAHQLLGRARYFKNAAESLPEGIVAVDTEHRISWFNIAAMQLIGLRRHNRGQMVFSVLRLPQFLTLLDGAEHKDPVEVISPLLPDRILSVQVSPFLQGHSLLIIRDITAVKRAESVRRDFVANASHELRTPLTVMQGYLEAMQDAQDLRESYWAKPVNQMHNQTERMRKIVEDMLTLSTLEGSEDRLELTDVDVPLLLSYLIEEVRQLSGNRQHKVTLALDTRAHLWGHEEYLRSAFTNLASNAVRYTPDGGSIAIRWWEDANGMHLSVTDTGIGIESKHLPRLFERFYRADNARSRTTGGTGLGLSITRHVLERHQATLTIESELGKGSCFTCHFPLSQN